MPQLTQTISVFIIELTIVKEIKALKRLLAIILSAVIALSVCACGGGAKTAETTTAVETTIAAEKTTTVEETSDSTSQDNSKDEMEATSEPVMSKDEMLEIAVEGLDGYNFYQAISNNILKARNEYEGHVYEVFDCIRSIEEDHVVLGMRQGNLKLKVYLPVEELIKLDKGQYIKVVGLLENIGEEQDMSFVYGTGDMYTAYLLSDTVEYSMVIDQLEYAADNDGTMFTYATIEGKPNAERLIAFDDETRLTLKKGDVVKLRGRQFYNESSMWPSKTSSSGKLVFELRDVTVLESTHPDNFEELAKDEIINNFNTKFVEEYIDAFEKVSNDDIASVIIGKWKSSRGYYEIFNEDGTYIAGDPDDSKVYDVTFEWSVNENFIDIGGAKWELYKLFDDVYYIRLNTNIPSGNILIRQ